MKKRNHILNLKIHSNKSQLTMFIILGIVIISIFGFVFFATGQIARQRTEQQAEQIFAEILETTSLKFYVNRCTERALSEGIDLVSKQGGRIYFSQGGPESNNYEKVFLLEDKGKTYDIGYGILKENLPLPQYPCKIGFTDYDKPPAFCGYTQVKSTFNNMDFGIANLPQLCKDRYGGCSIREGWNPLFSLQSQLEQFIANSVKKCVNFSSIIGINQSYDIKEGNVTSNITFSNTDITATVNFPITVSPPASQPVTKLISFESSYITNFKQMYGLAREAIVSDVSSPTAPSNKIVEKFKDLMKKRFNNNEPYAIIKQGNVSFFDDLIRIVDLTAPAGTETILQFVLENRPPVLNQIDPYAPYPAVVAEGCSQFDLIAVENQLLSLEPLAFDTDEDKITYSYSGWLEEYNETIGNEVIDPISKCVKSYSKIPIYYEPDKPGQIRWIKPNDFESNGKASAFITTKDIGPHNLRITVCDEQNYCDYQDIRVLIDDMIKIAVEPKNKLGTRTFSLEDPYTFTAEITDIYNPGAYAFSWKITPQDMPDVILFEQEAADQILNIPPIGYTISDIKEKMQEIVPFIKGNKYDVIAEVAQYGGPPVINDTEIEVMECIPTPGNTNEPYPYNEPGSDPFLANHACCNNDMNNIGTYKGTSAICYTEATYGSYKSFVENKYQTSYNPQPITKVGLNLLQPIIGTIMNNDIIKRTFERKCESERGNTCGGTMIETYTAISCQDKTTEFATCQGPAPSLFSLGSETPTQPACFKYLGTTFEKLAGIPNADEHCNAAMKCITDINAIDGFSESKITAEKHFICNATCDGKGTCLKPIASKCHNCYNDQTCSKAGNTLTATVYSGCSATACSFNTITQTDGCVGNDLRVWSCTGIKTPTQLYKYDNIDCRYYGETEANDPDGNIPTITPGPCTANSLGSCSSDKCNPGPPTTYTDDKFYLENNQYKFKEYVKQNIWTAPGTSEQIKESCGFVTYDYDGPSIPVDVAKFICSTSTFPNGAAGVWNDAQNCCRGDDLTETCPLP